MAIATYQTKQGRRYKAEMYANGKRIASKRGFQTKKEARDWLRDAEKAPVQPQHQRQTLITFEQLANAYLTEIQDRRKRNTYIYKRGTFRRVLAFSGYTTLLRDVTRDHLAEYLRIQKEERGEKAANCDLREISTLFKWGMKHGHTVHNPAISIESYATKSYVRYVPPAEDIAAVRMASTKEERQIIDTLYFTAARLSEVLGMTWEDVNFEARALRLWTSKRRGGNKEPRVLGIHDDLHGLLWGIWQERDKTNPYVFPNPLTGVPYHRISGFIRDLFKRVCERAGLEKPFTAHAIRHHVASRISDSHKATTRQIQKFLGHMNVRTTEIYLHELHVDHSILDAFNTPENTTSKAQNDT